MSKKNKKKITSRDIFLEAIITTFGGVVRVFEDKKKKSKTDKSNRKIKHKNRKFLE